MSDAFVSTLRVTAHEPDEARVSVRKAQFVVGRPLELDAASGRIGALEYALGALAGEVVNGLRHFAWRRRVDVEQVEALVTGELAHGLAYLDVVGEDDPPRLARVHLKVFVASADEPGVRALWTHLIARLPLLGTLRAAVPIQLDLIVTP
jgi:hypothetical protein